MPISKNSKVLPRTRNFSSVHIISNFFLHANLLAWNVCIFIHTYVLTKEQSRNFEINFGRYHSRRIVIIKFTKFNFSYPKTSANIIQKIWKVHIYYTHLCARSFVVGLEILGKYSRGLTSSPLAILTVLSKQTSGK